MKKEKKLFTAVLAALCIVLSALCIVLAVGWGKAKKTTAMLPRVQNNGTAIQWKYADEQEWHDLVALLMRRRTERWKRAKPWEPCCRFCFC